MKGQLVQFKLVKFGFLDYLLSAQVKFNKIYRSKQIEDLPFDED